MGEREPGSGEDGGHAGVRDILLLLVIVGLLWGVILLGLASQARRWALS